MSTRDKILDITFLQVYKYGYTGTSISMILKECNIPKGSLYHYFKSKKELVLATLEERIDPKMNDFFGFLQIDGENGIDTIIKSINKISSNEYLILYGCPLNRLNQEMSNIDEDFQKDINIIYERIKLKISSLLHSVQLKNKELDIVSLADFIILSVWGALSLSEKQASKKRFQKNISHLINYLQSLKK